MKKYKSLAGALLLLTAYQHAAAQVPATQAAAQAATTSQVRSKTAARTALQQASTKATATGTTTTTQTTTVTTGQAVDKPMANFSGFYTGIKGGGAITSTNGNTSIVSSLIDSFQETNTLGGSGTWNRNRYAFVGSVLIGYSEVFDNFYLGSELFASFAGRDSAANTTLNSSVNFPDSYTISQTLSNQVKVAGNAGEYGVDFKPGIYYCNTILFVRAGLAYSRLRLTNQTTLTYVDINPGLDVPANIASTYTFNQSSSKRTLGVRIGFGLEQKITDRVGITVDYIYTDYGRLSVGGSTPIVTPFGTVASGYTGSSKVTIRNNAILIGLTYKFC